MWRALVPSVLRSSAASSKTHRVIWSGVSTPIPGRDAYCDCVIDPFLIQTVAILDVIIFVRSFSTHSVRAIGRVSSMLVGASVFGIARMRASSQSCGLSLFGVLLS